MTRRYDAILFDFDGVLLDSEPIHFECWRSVLRPLGIRLEWDYYRQHCVGLAEEPTMQIFAQLATPQVPLSEVRAKYPEKQALFRDRVLAAPPFDAATLKIVKSLKNYKLAVVSSSSGLEIEPLLAAAGIRHCFQALVFGEHVQRPKPAPDPYLLAARRLDARTPLVVEDSQIGLESAKAAGFEALFVPKAADMPALLAARLGADPPQKS